MGGLYRGKGVKEFLVDRLAMGFSDEAIKQEFLASFDRPITDDEILQIVGSCEDEVRKREQEILAEISSSNFFSTLTKMRDDLSSVQKKLIENEDFKTYAQVTNSLIKTVEVLVATSNTIRQKVSDRRVSVQNNNFLVINTLESDGLIKIIDKDRLQSLFGISSKKKENKNENDVIDVKVD